MNRRDLELLSSYLDGQLKPSDSARLEARLKSDPQLDSVLNDLREARGFLRRLPARKAPRNFTLTRKMVGQNPPMPRAYPIFRFATALATLLFFFTVGLNFVTPQLASQAPAVGMGGGGGEPELFAAEAATEAPAESAADLAPLATALPTLDDAARLNETPTVKNGEESVVQDQPQVQNEAPLFSSVWQVVLAVIAIASGLLVALMRQLSVRRWK